LGKVTGQIVAGAAATESYLLFADAGNTLGGTTVPIFSTGILPVGSANPSGTLALGAPFSLTQVEEIVASGPTFFNTDVSFQVVPEPGTMGLVACGLAALTLVRARRRNG
jgi:hypothetical protein